MIIGPQNIKLFVFLMYLFVFILFLKVDNYVFAACYFWHVLRKCSQTGKLTNKEKFNSASSSIFELLK
jgi:hypothetical protein